MDRLPYLFENEKTMTRFCIVLAFAAVVLCAAAADAVRNDRTPRGGRRPIDVGHPDVLKAAQFAVPHVAPKMRSAEPFRLIQILSAEVQIVAGKKFYLQVQLQRASKSRPEQMVLVVWRRLNGT